MTTSRLLVLALALAFGLGAVFVVPNRGNAQPAGITLQLPEFVGRWYGVEQEITQRERDSLAADTQFARKLYADGAGNAVFVSIVMSGSDLDNSIHRPERCLPAQGWTIANSNRVAVPVTPVTSIDTTRLHNVRQVPLPTGGVRPVFNLNYYWFVGYQRHTASHLERTFFDLQDRVIGGYNQRWAYITIAADITDGVVRFGRTEAQTDAMLRDFIRQLYPVINSPGAL